MKKIALFLILLAICNHTYPFQKEDVSFHKFPLKEMLPGSSIKRVFQDNKGFIWLGTESGICRYDGYSLMTIKSNIENPTLLTSGNILCIEQDKQNRIWFGTDRGVNILDQNNRIIPVITDSIIQNLRINSIVSDSQGFVWLGTENGLFRFKDAHTPIERFYKDSSGIPGNNVNNIFEDKDGEIWVALWRDGLCRYNNKTNNFEVMPQM